MGDNPFDYTTITDVETRAKVLQTAEFVRQLTCLFGHVGRIFRKKA